MPLIQVTATKNTLNEENKNQLMKRISNAVLKAERAPVEDAGAQSLVWAYFHELPVNDVYVGGENLEKAPIRIAITTPEGALNTSTRKELIEEVAAIVDEFYQTFDDRLNHWVMLHDQTEGNWAGGGQVFPLAAIQAAMNIQPTK